MAGKLFDPRILEPAGTNGFGIQLFPPPNLYLACPLWSNPYGLSCQISWNSSPIQMLCQQEERNLKLIYSIIARSRLRYGLFILNGLVLPRPPDGNLSFGLKSWRRLLPTSKSEKAPCTKLDFDLVWEIWNERKRAKFESSQPNLPSFLARVHAIFLDISRKLS